MSDPKDLPKRRLEASGTSFEIPSEAVGSLKKIAELDEGLFEALLKAIADTSPTLSAGQFASRIAEKITKLSAGDLKAVLTTAFNLHLLKEKLREPMTVEEQIRRIVSSDVVTKGVPAKSRALLSDRMAKLLTFDASLGVTAKAYDVMTECDHVFCEARILSDIRPVFTGGANAASGAMIIHNLKIGYHQDGRHRDFYVALDANDLKALKNVIERAETKAAGMETMIKDSKVSYLEP